MYSPTIEGRLELGDDNQLRAAAYVNAEQTFDDELSWHVYRVLDDGEGGKVEMPLFAASNSGKILGAGGFGHIGDGRVSTPLSTYLGSDQTATYRLYAWSDAFKIGQTIEQTFTGHTLVPPVTPGVAGDLNADGKVDLTDFGILKDNFGKSAAVVPEPATWLLAAIGALLGCARARVRRAG